MSTEEHRGYFGKQEVIRALLSDMDLPKSGYHIKMEAYKHEQVVEVYIKANNEDWVLMRSYRFCKFSGDLGPKLREGDRQIPEGIYKVVVFNPKSKFYLSLGLDYPNERDMLIADADDPGSDIYIHGGCSTVGCIPITDEKMAELFLLAKGAVSPIEVIILPFQATEKNFEKFYLKYPQWRSFWDQLYRDVNGRLERIPQ